MDLADLLGDNSSQSYKEKKASGKKSEFLNVLQKTRPSLNHDNRQNLNSANNMNTNMNTNINNNNSSLSGDEVSIRFTLS